MPRRRTDTVTVLPAAATEIAERGVDRFRMDDVARRAGVAKGVLYLRYADKSDLVAAVLDYELAAAANAARDRVRADARGGLLSRTFVHSSAAVYARPALLSFYQRDAGDLVRRARDLPAQRREARAIIGADYIRALQSDRIVRDDIDPDGLARTLTIWNVGLALTAPHADLAAHIEGMGRLVAAAADTDIGDPSLGVAHFGRFVDALVAERSQP